MAIGDHWVEVQCKICESKNWICIGDFSDLSKEPYTSFRCWECDEHQWLPECPEEGLEEDLDDSWTADGRRNPLVIKETASTYLFGVRAGVQPLVGGYLDGYLTTMGYVNEKLSAKCLFRSMDDVQDIIRMVERCGDGKVKIGSVVEFDVVPREG